MRYCSRQGARAAQRATAAAVTDPVPRPRGYAAERLLEGRLRLWAGRHRSGRGDCGELTQVAFRVDPGAPAALGELGGQRPAVGPWIPLVLGARALERHRPLVVADGADLGDLLGGEG